MTEEPVVYTVPEAAAVIRVHPQTLRAAIARGEIVGVRVGRRVLVPRAALEAALAGGNGREPPDVNGPARGEPARTTDEERAS